MSDNVQTLMKRADAICVSEFGRDVYFERAIFLSWYCSTPDCTFCFMSLIKDKIPQPSKARRRWESVLAEIVLCNALDWKIGFLSAGIKAYTPSRLARLCEISKSLVDDPLSINVGALTSKQLGVLSPHIGGICAAVETVDWDLRKKVCPTKPIEPYLEMLDEAKALDLERSMTIIIGIGETRDSYGELRRFIREHKIQKIVVYGIVPHEGSPFQETCDPLEQAWWIASMRVDFPTLHITAGIWHDRADSLTLMLRSGANAFSKFQAFKYYGKKQADDLVKATRNAGRHLTSMITGEQGIKLGEGILSQNLALKEDISTDLFLKKATKYVARMKKNQYSGGLSPILS